MKPLVGTSIASFDAPSGVEERQYVLNLPTMLSLPPEAVDQLRAAESRFRATA